MITRPDGLVFCEVDLWFNLRPYDTLEIDLEHINIGKNKTRQLYFTAEEIKKIVLKLIGEESLVPVDRKQFKHELCDYYLKIGKYNSKKYKLVFCICSDQPRSIGIITLFRF